MQSCGSFVYMTVGNSGPLALKVDYSQHLLCGQNSWSQIMMLQRPCKVMANIFQAVQNTPCILFQPQRIDHMTVFPSDKHFVLVGLGLWSWEGNRTEGRKGKLSFWLSTGLSVASVWLKLEYTCVQDRIGIKGGGYSYIIEAMFLSLSFCHVQLEH